MTNSEKAKAEIDKITKFYESLDIQDERTNEIIKSSLADIGHAIRMSFGLAIGELENND